MRRESCILQKSLKPVTYKPCGVKDKFDIIFAIDASRRPVGDSITNHMAKFVRTFMRSFTISRTETRFGMVLYDANGATDILPLQQGDTVQSVEIALDTIRSLGGKQGVHVLPNYVLDNIFTTSNRRFGAKRILVVMTTGLDDNAASAEVFDKEAVTVFNDIRLKSKADVISVVINDQSFRQRANIMSTSKKDVLFMQNIMELPGHLGDLEQIVAFKQGRI